MSACYLTTTDNNYDPSIDFDAWWNEDRRLGYDTCGKLNRYTVMLGWTDDLSDERQAAIIEDAIDMIVDNDFLGLYKKIKKEDKTETKNDLENKESS